MTMTKKTPIVQSFLVTVEQEKPIPDLCDKIASRAWGIDGVNTMSSRGAVTALEVKADPFDAAVDTKRFVDGLLGSNMWQLDPRRPDEAREHLRHMLENFLRQHGGAPKQEAAAFCAVGIIDGKRVAIPRYAAHSAPAVGELIMESATREGYKGTLRERLESLGWSIVPMAYAEIPLISVGY